jgi:hypothetical protein
MSEKVIKTTNKVQVVGTLVETGNLAFDKDAKNEKTKAEGAISRVDFKKPSFVIDVNGQKIGVNTLPTYTKKLDKDGKTLIENPQFKALEKIMTYEVGTRVKVDGSISVGNPYMGKNGIVEPVSINMFSMSASGVPTDDFAEGKISGIIKSIKAETVGEDDDETGRLVVDFWIYDGYNKSVSPFPLVVDKDDADGFEDAFDNGDSVLLDFDIAVRHVGGKSESKGFGSRKSKIVSGFSVTEYVVFNGEAYDDESEYYIDEDDFKTLLKAHKQKCEEAKNAKTNKDDDTPKKGLGSARKSKIEDSDDDEYPFDD